MQIVLFILVFYTPQGFRKSTVNPASLRTRRTLYRLFRRCILVSVRMHPRNYIQFPDGTTRTRIYPRGTPKHAYHDMQPLSDVWEDAEGNTIEGPELHRRLQMCIEYQTANSPCRRHDLSIEEYGRYLEALREYRIGETAEIQKPRPEDFREISP